jgi:endonuclease G, mitochondrial
MRIGRLAGVLLKQPFAVQKDLPVPSDRTRAFRAWNLVDATCFDDPARMSTWQHQALEEIRRELSQGDPFWASQSLYQLAEKAHSEGGLFTFFAWTLRRYICSDKKVRKKVEDALAQARKSGTKLPSVTPEAMVGAGGLTLGVYLVQAVPILGMVGAPVIAAVVVILYTLGVNAFCQWSESVRTDEDKER